MTKRFMFTATHEFDSLSELANFFSDVMTEAEANRDEITHDIDSTIVGSGWEIEDNND